MHPEGLFYLHLFHSLTTFIHTEVLCNLLHQFCLNKTPALISHLHLPPLGYMRPSWRKEGSVCLRSLLSCKCLFFSLGTIVNIAPPWSLQRALKPQSTDSSKLSSRILLIFEDFHQDMGERDSLQLFLIYLVFCFPEMFGYCFHINGILTKVILFREITRVTTFQVLLSLS